MSPVTDAPVIGFKMNNQLQLDPQAVVDAVYQSLLGRAPDPGASWKSEKLSTGELTLVELLRDILQSSEYLERLPIRDELLNDHTQFGELKLLLGRWVARSAPQPVVVDVGARGKARSNSFDLMKAFGWRGILIEANPALALQIGLEFADLDYTLLNCAVSDFDGFGEFHLGINDDVSSLNESASLSWGATRGIIEVEIRRLPPLLREHGVPTDFGLLSIDIEGEDIKVFNDLLEHSDYRPQWVVIEASYDFATKSLYDLPFGDVARKDYALIAQTAANLILEYKSA